MGQREDVALNIEKVPVKFPLQPYSVQKAYMAAVIRALHGSTNALLESPTGTGKTLCLLCSILAWRSLAVERRTATANGPTIGVVNQADVSYPVIYASRTHGQLAQVCRELKRISYRPRMSILASRDQLCVHEDLRSLSGRDLDAKCLNMRRGMNQCPYQMPADSPATATIDSFLPRPFDLEDLRSTCRKQKICPYYLARERATTAELVLLPYNYLLDPRFSKRITLPLKESIIVFDEAHNVDSVCSESASFDLTSTDITGCLRECDAVIAHMKADMEKGDKRDSATGFDLGPRNLESFALLVKAGFLELESFIVKELQVPKDGLAKEGVFIKRVFKSFGPDSNEQGETIKYIDAASQYLASKTETNAKRSPWLEKFLRMAQVAVDANGKEDLDLPNFDKFRVFITHSAKTAPKKATSFFNAFAAAAGEANSGKGYSIGFWCFDPGLAFKRLAVGGAVRSIILTSGTLSPMKSIPYELSIPFNVTLENPHVVDAKQIMVGIVSKGPAGKALNSSYKTRGDREYIADVGRAIVNFARVVPEGMLVFFPSYSMLEEYIDTWTQTYRVDIWDRLKQLKEIVMEPRMSSELENSMDEYYGVLNQENSIGCVYFAVCRGKVAEGLDFADKYGRAVVLVGLPYANSTQPKVKLKRQYMDTRYAKLTPSERKNNLGIGGQAWYTQQATRAVNQAIGRIIRHAKDYGAILLCDERYSAYGIRSQISRWLLDEIRVYPRFGLVAKALGEFFRANRGAEAPRTPAPISLPAKRPSTETAFEAVRPSLKGALPDQNDAEGMTNWAQFRDVAPPLGAGNEKSAPGLFDVSFEELSTHQKAVRVLKSYEGAKQPRERDVGMVELMRAGKKMRKEQDELRNQFAAEQSPAGPPRANVFKVAGREETREHLAQTDSEQARGKSRHVKRGQQVMGKAKKALSSIEFDRFRGIVQEFSKRDRSENVMKGFEEKITELIIGPMRNSPAKYSEEAILSRTYLAKQLSNTLPVALREPYCRRIQKAAAEIRQMKTPATQSDDDIQVISEAQALSRSAIKNKSRQKAPPNPAEYNVFYDR